MTRRSGGLSVPVCVRLDPQNPSVPLASGVVVRLVRLVRADLASAAESCAGTVQELE